LVKLTPVRTNFLRFWLSWWLQRLGKNYNHFLRYSFRLFSSPVFLPLNQKKKKKLIFETYFSIFGFSSQLSSIFCFVGIPVKVNFSDRLLKDDQLITIIIFVSKLDSKKIMLKRLKISFNHQKESKYFQLFLSVDFLF
jgi:hypothetical protein